MKICNKCKQEKLLSSFSRSTASKDGLTARCKECDKEYYDTNKDKMIGYRVKYKEVRAKSRKEKQLEKWKLLEKKAEEKAGKKEEKLATMDERYKERARKYREKNKEKIALQNKEYREKNKEKISEQRRLKYNLENHEQVLLNKKERADRLASTKEQRLATHRDRYKEYRANNLEKVREQSRIQKANRLEKDPLYKLRVYTGTAIANAMSSKRYKKTSTTANILGCTFEVFYLHIESQFKEGMTWDNRIEWHLDHIIPVSFAESEEELIKLNHYSNFRPLWKMDNQNKADKLVEEALHHPIYLDIVSCRVKK
jgi:hypothetical protein